MTTLQAKQAARALKVLRSRIKKWSHKYGNSLEITWNEDLDRFIDQPELLKAVRWILCGDNPGVQEAEQRKYLIGPTGTRARNIMREMKVSPESEILVLNKTPISTPTTKELAPYRKSHLPLLRATQLAMICCIYQLMKASSANVWIIGLGECTSVAGWPLRKIRGGGYYNKYILPEFFTALERTLKRRPSLQDRVYITHHISMGAFDREKKVYMKASKLSQLNGTHIPRRRLKRSGGNLGTLRLTRILPLNRLLDLWPHKQTLLAPRVMKRPKKAQRKPKRP